MRADMSAGAGDALAQVIAAQKQGVAQGIASICSANPHVLEAAAYLAARDGSVLLVESTCNQVNQYGGYTGMNPSQFCQYVGQIANRLGLPMEQVILGGDHLGPNPWKHETAERAMARACELVRECVAAGYRKIHLDASMRCADDDACVPLPREVCAARTAELCSAAEVAQEALDPSPGAPQYVIGTEVPTPGGATAAECAPAVTTVEDAQETLALTKQAFLGRGLGSAWERTIALVVQPGVEFGDDRVHAYRPEAAAGLRRLIQGSDHLVYEVHSTDYQTKKALRRLVEDQFAILKVGPALTFALREALFALALMEEDWLGRDPAVERSHLIDLAERVMLEHPVHWESYYRGSDEKVRLARKYSYSDRIRYYWPMPELQAATLRLLANLERHRVPNSLLSQFLPEQYRKVRAGTLSNHPADLIRDRIASVLADYRYATCARGEASREADDT